MPTKKVDTKTTVAVKKVAQKVAKKVTKKAVTPKPSVPVAKKAVSKKATPSATKRPLRYADDTTSFWMTDGQVLNSLVALRNALDKMSNAVYAYHVGPGRNDFSSWVEAVLCDEACARDLVKAKTPKSAKTVVVNHLKFYKF